MAVAADLRKHVGEASRLLSLLSNEARLLILCHLSEAKELSVGELAHRIGLSQSALSQHLARLREAALVTTRREAQSIFYRVCDPKADRLLTLLHEMYCAAPQRPRQRDKAHAGRQAR